jgi:hypothetical protein
MDIEKDLFNTFKENGHLTTIWLFPAQEVVDDKYEHTTTKTFLNPVPVQGVVKSLSTDSLRWKFTGTLPMGSKQIICQKKYKILFKVAKKIKIGDSFFQTWIDDAKGFGIIEREEYIVVILKAKTDIQDNT